jgi:SAM-dependent methyltransferase
MDSPKREGKMSVARRFQPLQLAQRTGLAFRNAHYRLRGAPDGLPIPPRKLRELSWSVYRDISEFLTPGTADQLKAVLVRNGIDLVGIRNVLEFGCGVGRVVRQFRNDSFHLHGTDINPESIAWCSRKLTFAEFRVNDAEPPLSYDNDFFDFVYTFSVFTHLTLGQQVTWLAEMRRIIRPGGLFYLTTCGESYRCTLTGVEALAYNRDGAVVRQPQLAGIPELYGTCLAVNSPEDVRIRLLPGWDLLEFDAGEESKGSKGEMDMFLLRKPVGAMKP